MRRAVIDETEAQTVEGRVACFGAHMMKQDGVDYRMNDATSWDLAVMEAGPTKAIAISVHRAIPSLEIGVGLVAAMQVEDARLLIDSLNKAIAELEASAAAAAGAAIAKAARR